MNEYPEGIPGPLASEIQELKPLPWFGWSKPNEMVCASKIQVAWVNLRHWPKKFIWRPLVRVLWCSWKDHVIGDKGYFCYPFGSNMRDVWCDRCDKFDQIPFSEGGTPQIDEVEGEDWKSGA